VAIIIEIESSAVKSRSGVSAKGREYTIRDQDALCFKPGSRYPDKIKVNVPDGQSAYQPGRYELHPDSFQVSRFGNLEIRAVLSPLPAQKASA